MTERNKEIAVGAVLCILVFGLMATISGIYGIFYIASSVILAVLTVNLFLKKSWVAKTGAVILNSNLLFQIFMPKKYKIELKALRESEENQET